MIRSRHTFAGWLLSEFYSGPKLNEAFGKICLYGDKEDNGLPILMVANHFSWWDGFIQYRLSKACFRRKMHVMMLEEQLRKNRILNKCGCFSVNKNSRDIIQTLNYCIEVMSDPVNMVLLFPQGEIQSMHKEHIKFESGIGYVLKHISHEYNIILNVNLIDYNSEKKPQLNGHFQKLNGNDYKEFTALEKTYNLFYRECKTKQISSL